MFKSEYDQIIRENFDLSDNYTRTFIVSLKEDAQQEQLLRALSISLYESIVSKVDDIDFGSIPMSRGDITKVEGFAGTEQCLKTMRELVLQYKQDPSVIDVVITAINNVKERKHLFVKGYALNAEFPILLYNLLVLSIERCTSLMIATCIQFIKDPSSTTPKKALDKVAYKKTMEDVMFKQLMGFNNMCANKNFDKQLELSMKPIKESTDVETYSDTVLPVADEVPSNGIEDNSDDIFGSSEPAGQDVVNGASSENEGNYPWPTAKATEDTEPGQEPADNSSAAQQPTGPSEECGGSCATHEDDNAPESVPYQGVPGQSVDTTPEPVKVNDTTNNDDTIASDDEDIDIESIPYEDDVDAENIPSVNPGDAVSDTDAPINEDEVDDAEAEDETPIEEMTKNDITSAILKGLGKATKVANVENITNSIKNKPLGVKIGLGVVSALGLGTLIFAARNFIVDFLRKTIYTAYYTKAKFSDYLDVQADLLESNANELQFSTNSELDDDARAKAIKKQLATAEKFRKWSNFFSIDKKKTENEVNKASDEDMKKAKKIAKDDDGDDAVF